MVRIEDEIDGLLSQPEDTNLEFKEAREDFDNYKLFKYCAALANEGGGKLLLGISDQLPRRIVGSSAYPNLIHIEEKIYDKLSVRVQAEAINHPSGRVVIFHIPSRVSGFPVRLDGQYWMRSGERVVEMSSTRLREIFNESSEPWEYGVSRSDCSAEQVVELLDTQSYFDLRRLPYPINQSGVIERFVKEKLVTISSSHSFSITNLGGILFAKDLEHFPTLNRKAPRVIVYDGNNKLKTKLERIGIKGYAVGFENLVSFVASHTPANEVIEDTLRREVRMFPDIAIREVVANALIHQDFTVSGSGVTIEVYNDRMEIFNPGVSSVAPNRFIDENRSRNEKLADLMRSLNICEERGSGIDKVVHAAEVFQLPAPDFRVGEVGTKVFLFGHKNFEEMDKVDRIRATYQHCCLKYVMNERMTNFTLRERFKLSEKKTEAVSRAIKDTLQDGQIKVSDPTQTSTRYRSYVPIWA